MAEAPEPRDAIAAVVHPDPYPYYALLRQQRPLYFEGGLNLWVASSHEAVQAALGHPALRVRPPAEPMPKALIGTPTGDVFARLVRMNDGEFHRQHRPDVERAAGRFSMAQVTAAAEEAARDLAPRLSANALLSALPVQAMARLLGVPAASLDRTVACVEAFVQGIAANATGEAISRANEAVLELMGQGEAQGLDAVRSANRIAFMQQSLDATAGLLGNAALMALRQPGLIDAAAPLTAWRSFAAEVARWDSPVQNTRRFAAEDLVLCGEEISQGQCLVVVLASANRDGALNTQPDRFDTARHNRRSMSFGSGAHACPGEAIAVEIAAAALRTFAGAGQFELFRNPTGFRPLANARIPTFAN